MNCLKSPAASPALRRQRKDLPEEANAAGAGLIALLLCSCAVGPTYRPPAALGTNAMPAAFSERGTNATQWKVADPSAHLEHGTWWEIFGDSELNRLETLATSHNQQLSAALANYEQARAQLGVARSGFYPQVSLDPSVIRERTSASLAKNGNFRRGSSTFTTFTMPAEASWELDLWGRIRRETEAAKGRLLAAGDDFEAAKLSIQAEVAIDYFSLRSLDEQHALLDQTVETFQHSLNLTQTRRRGGIATELDVSQAETQLKTAQAELPAVDLQRANFLHAIATLCGEPATTFRIGTTNTPMTGVPGIPLSVPSELLERRPDIAAAERRMAAANADIGVATAAFYPRVLLSGMAGYQSIDIGTLFDWPSHVWSVGPSLQLPLFTGGRNRSQLAAARAAYDAAIADYRQVVLTAFQDVEDQLAAGRLLAEELDALNAALAAAKRTLNIANSRYRGGVSTYLEVATAQGAALNTEQAAVKIRGQRLVSAVSLIKSLGAGWNATNNVVVKQPSS